MGSIWVEDTDVFITIYAFHLWYKGCVDLFPAPHSGGHVESIYTTGFGRHYKSMLHAPVSQLLITYQYATVVNSVFQ